MDYWNDGRAYPSKYLMATIFLFLFYFIWKTEKYAYKSIRELQMVGMNNSSKPKAFTKNDLKKNCSCDATAI